MTETTNPTPKLTVAQVNGGQWVVRDHQDRVLATAPSRAKARDAKKQLEAHPQFQEACADLEVRLEEATPQPAATKVERVKLAKAEHKVLQAWIKDGEKPPRPATPNLDAIEAESAANGGDSRKKSAGGKKADSTARRTSQPTPVKLPAGTGKMTEDEVIRFIKANPECSWSTLTNHLRKNGRSCSNARFRRIMDSLATSAAA